MKMKKIGILALFVLLVGSLGFTFLSTDNQANAAVTDNVYNVNLDASYATIHGALSDTRLANGHVIEVYNDIVESTPTNISKNVTIKAANGKNPTITAMNTDTSTLENILYNIEKGAEVTFGGGSNSSVLHYVSDMRIIHGASSTLIFNDGLSIKSSAIHEAIIMEGSGNTFRGNGGHIENTGDAGENLGNTALLLSESTGYIDGGTYIGDKNTVALHNSHLSRVSCVIKAMNKSAIKATAAAPALRLYNSSRIDAITGGEYYGYRCGDAIALTRDSSTYTLGTSSIGSISNATIHSESLTTMEDYQTRYGLGLCVYSTNSNAIGSIKNCKISGSYAILSFGNIGEISNNDITGYNRGIQIESTGAIKEISNNTITTDSNNGFGFLAVGNIDLIKDNTMTCNGRYGICLYSATTVIKEIDGGTYICNNGNSIKNLGTLELIKDGTFISKLNTVDCINNDVHAKVNKIDNGTFYSQDGVALELADSCIIEEGLTGTPIGNGRYWGKDGKIYEDGIEELHAIYPATYHMSTGTTKVENVSDKTFGTLDLSGVEFKALVKDVTVSYDANGGQGTAPTTEQVSPLSTITLKDNTYTNGDLVFSGWSTQPNGGTIYKPGDELLILNDTVLYAQWSVKRDVIYSFVSQDPNLTLPQAVLDLIPVDTNTYIDGDQLVIKELLNTTVSVDGGIWTFVGWDQESPLIINGNIVITGTWEFKENVYNVDKPTEDNKKPVKTDDANMLLEYSTICLGSLIVLLYTFKKKIEA